jgi:effector-binding domain-containing protein
MKKFFVAVVAVCVVLVALAAVLVLRYGSSPEVDPTRYEGLKDPVIRTLPDQRVIEVEVAGRPEESAGRAIGLLYRTWGRLDVDRSTPVAPRARWPRGSATPVDQWVGRFALPVPDTVGSLPDPPGGSDLNPRLATWTYGETAEILHVGAYDTEGPTIARLQRAIVERGYEIAGDHEEEYVKGPGMILAGDPDKWLTILRYPVRPVVTPEP